jgi:hypothetical protein
VSRKQTDAVAGRNSESSEEAKPSSLIERSAGDTGDAAVDAAGPPPDTPWYYIGAMRYLGSVVDECPQYVLRRLRELAKESEGLEGRMTYGRR